MSKLDSKSWSELTKENLNKYEKCRNITEEIYKRINITFQIKKLENAAQSELSDNSDQIDSNELSNETDLFACDKSDSIPSSNEGKAVDKPAPAQDKYININNNEETKKKAVAVYKRPKKRFRKRVKKRQSKTRDSDGSSDEAEPLSRVADIAAVTKDLKPKILPADTMPLQTATIFVKHIEKNDSKEKLAIDTKIINKKVAETKNCAMCSLSFRGDRGLRRHMAMTHIIESGDIKAKGKPI